uniref:ribonuclease H n=1 Tax=Seriola dumerili TaxID=41447 RepID=A0A3B4U985_SERDU
VICTSIIKSETESLSQNANINVEAADVTHSFLISDKSPINLMGRDLLCNLHASIYSFQTQTITHLGEEMYMLFLSAHIQLPHSNFVMHQPPPPPQYGPPSELAEVPYTLWAKHKNHIGLVTSAPPHQVTLKPNVSLPRIRQYRIPPKAIAGIEDVIQSLCMPMLPIPKPNRPDEWYFVQDLQAIDSIMIPPAAVVTDTNAILTSLPSNSRYYMVVDLCSAFFSIPLHPDSQYLFAFTFKGSSGRQYTWKTLPQGFVSSPTVYAAAVKRDLDNLEFPGGSIFLQYTDNLLIASPLEEACHTDSILLLQRLAECGHRASLARLQFCRAEVTYSARQRIRKPAGKHSCCNVGA